MHHVCCHKPQAPSWLKPFQAASETNDADKCIPTSAALKNMPKQSILSDILFSHFCLQLKLWEFKINILASELLIDTRKSFHLQGKK